MLPLLALLLAAEPVHIWPRADLQKQAAPLRNLEGKPLGVIDGHSATLWRRTTSGRAELHKNKTDLLLITEGSATLLYGGSIPDARAESAVEVRGSTIVKGTERRLAPGDLIHIPPNTPHQFLLEKGGSISYVAIKLGR